jgi:hypothetical protein
VVYKHLLDYAAGRTVTEMAKKEDCWMSFRDINIELPPLDADLESAGSVQTRNASSGSIQNGAHLSAAELQESVQRVKLQTWGELADWTEQQANTPRWKVTTCRALHAKLQKGTRLKQDECKLLMDLINAARAQGFHG